VLKYRRRLLKKFRKNLGKSSVIIKDYKVSYDKKKNVLNLSKPQKYSKDLLDMYKIFIKFP